MVLINVCLVRKLKLQVLMMFCHLFCGGVVLPHAWRKVYHFEYAHTSSMWERFLMGSAMMTFAL